MQRKKNRIAGKEAPVILRKDFEALVKKITNVVRVEYSKELAKLNINDFTSAIDSPAKKLNTMLSTALANIKDKVGDDWITKAVNAIMRRINAVGHSNISVSLSKIGVSADLLLKKDVSGLIKINSKRVSEELKALREETLKRQHRQAMRMIAQGAKVTKIRKQLANERPKQVNRAIFIARNELKETNRLLNEKRAVNLGLKKAIWVTAKDERVRKCHNERDGKEYTIGKGIYSACDGKTLSPGEDFNCRCVSEYILD